MIREKLKAHKKRITGLIVLAVVSQVMIYFAIISPTSKLYAQSISVYKSATDLNRSIKAKRWDTTEKNLGVVHAKVDSLISDLQNLKLLSIVPYVSSYYHELPKFVELENSAYDIGSGLMTDMYPYHAILGFSVESEEAFDSSMETIMAASPQLVTVLKPYVSQVKNLVDDVYKLDLERLANLPLQSESNPVNLIIGKKDAIDETLDAIDNVLLVVPEIVGATEPKTYLLLFQNDKELRPTGGFITAYATMNLDAGEISVSGSDSIYEISEDGANRYVSPWPIQVYLNQEIWHLRDMNFSPDYNESMSTFYSYWLQLGQSPVDGIISIDTQFAQKILEVVGDIKVEGYDFAFDGWVGLPEACRTGGENFTKDNVVCRLEAYAEKVGLEQTERKSVIGELMSAILKHVLTTKGENVLPLVKQVINQLDEKHILLRFENSDAQQFAHTLDWTGEVTRDYNGDYLYVNDANLGGLKSDLYLERSVDQSYESNNGEVVKTVSITYENTGAFDGWLNATSRNYLRVYVPAGSELLSVDGGEFESNVYEEFGYTVFDNFVRIPSLSSKTITFTYKLPSSALESHKLLIQKQPGVDRA